VNVSANFSDEVSEWLSSQREKPDVLLEDAVGLLKYAREIESAGGRILAEKGDGSVVQVTIR
jgi:hypothetical protein